MDRDSLEYYESIHQAEYVTEMRRLREGASPEALAICRAWNAHAGAGDRFGWPGYGSVVWVAMELDRAEKAVVALREFDAQRIERTR